MQALIEWAMSNEPCTTKQAAIVCAVVFGVMMLELVLVARLCAKKGE